MKRISLALLLVTASLLRPVGAQTPPNNRRLEAALTALRFAVDSMPPDVRSQRLSAAVRWLRNHFPPDDPSQVSADYIRSLEADAALLQNPPAPTVIDDVLAELEAKVEHCTRLNIGMGGSITVTVNTRRNGAAVSNLQVRYLLKIYEHVNGASATDFPVLSSPAAARVEPGRYWVWARDPASGKESQRALLKIAGQPNLLVDLPVP